MRASCAALRSAGGVVTAGNDLRLATTLGVPQQLAPLRSALISLNTAPLARERLAEVHDPGGLRCDLHLARALSDTRTIVGGIAEHLIDQILAKVAGAPTPKHYGDLAAVPDLDLREIILLSVYNEELAALRGAPLPATLAKNKRTALEAGCSQAEIDEALSRAESDFATGTHVTFAPPRKKS